MRERREQVLKVLSRKGYRSVSELSKDLQVSEMTIRRYLDQLEQDGLIRRTYGGAFVGKDMMEVDYRIRESVNAAQKEVIGRLAWSLLEPGESVFIDSGTTTAYVAASADDSKRITVVTNSTIALQTLESNSEVETIFLGGRLHAASHSVTGPVAEEVVGQFRFNKAFLGTAGINLREGFTQSNIDEVPVKKIVAKNAGEIYVLADSSKFDRNLLVLFLHLEDVTGVVTDAGILPEHREALEERGVRVFVADLQEDLTAKGP